MIFNWFSIFFNLIESLDPNWFLDYSIDLHMLWCCDRAVGPPRTIKWFVASLWPCHGTVFFPLCHVHMLWCYWGLSAHHTPQCGVWRVGKPPHCIYLVVFKSGVGGAFGPPVYDRPKTPSNTVVFSLQLPVVDTKWCKVGLPPCPTPFYVL